MDQDNLPENCDCLCNWLKIACAESKRAACEESRGIDQCFLCNRRSASPHADAPPKRFFDKRTTIAFWIHESTHASPSADPVDGDGGLEAADCRGAPVRVYVPCLSRCKICLQRFLATKLLSVIDLRGWEEKSGRVCV